MSHRLRPSPIRAILDRQRAPGILSLAGGLPAPGLFPLASLAEAARRAAAEVATWQYAGSCGLPDLRAWIAERLRRRGVATRPEQVLITNGSQHALLLAALALLEPGGCVAVEAPGYPGAYQALAVTGASVVGLGEGVERLRALAKRRRIDLLHCMPSGQNPTGRTLDGAQRVAYAAACAAAGVCVLEDDAYGELWYEEQPAQPLAAMHADCLLAGSFSKILAPGLRLGWLRAPEPRLGDLTLALQASALHANGLAQATVLAWLGRQDLEAHLVRLRVAYRERRDALCAALAARWPLPPPCPRCGMFLWLPLPSGWTGGAFAEAALAAGVAVVPGGGCHPDGGPDDHIRLCFATETPKRLVMAAGILGGLVARSSDPPAIAAQSA